MRTCVEQGRLGIGDGRARDRSVRWSAWALLAGGLLLVAGPVGGGGVAEGANFCQRTSATVLASCQAGADSDKLLALGKCENISNTAARSACTKQAFADEKDALQTCNAQFDARQAACARLGGARYDPVIDPANFVARIDNPLFPLTPGTTFVFEGQTAAGF